MCGREVRTSDQHRLRTYIVDIFVIKAPQYVLVWIEIQHDVTRAQLGSICRKFLYIKPA